MSPSPCSTAAPMVAAALFNSAAPPPSLRSRPSRCCSRAAVDGAPPPHMALYVRTIRAGRVSCSGRSTTRRPRTAASPLAPGARRRVAAVLLLNGDPCRPPCVPFATWRPHLTRLQHRGQILNYFGQKIWALFWLQTSVKSDMIAVRLLSNIASYI